MTYVRHCSIGPASLTDSAVTACADAETWYALQGTFIDGLLSDFSLDTDTGVLTYDGRNNKAFAFHGTSNLKSSKVCNLTYALVINDVVQTSAMSLTTFNNANSYRNLAIIRPITLNNGDTLQIKMKSSAASTNITVDTLNLLLKSGSGLK